MNDLPAKEATSRFGAAVGQVAWMLAASVAGACLASVLVGQFGDYFQASPEAIQAAAESAMAGSPPDPEVERELIAAARQRIILKLALTGASVAGLLCCCASMLVSGMPRAVVGLVSGAVLGAVFGAVGGIVGVEVSGWAAGRFSRLVDELLVQFSVWACVGAGVGLSMAFTGQRLRRVPASIGLGIVGGVLGVVLQQFVFMVVFPLEDSRLIVPMLDRSRLTWAMIGASSVGVVLARTLGTRPVRPPAEVAET